MSELINVLVQLNVHTKFGNCSQFFEELSCGNSSVHKQTNPYVELLGSNIKTHLILTIFLHFGLTIYLKYILGFFTCTFSFNFVRKNIIIKLKRKLHVTLIYPKVNNGRITEL
eukprot:GHVU01220776.1.p1 GENE.GHVU01220776.1~~GHVU01220776.1.p1  ORF type:complete len:113 (-),score=0.48 GHVU01220776.1:672-1010(-)